MTLIVANRAGSGQRPLGGPLQRLSLAERPGQKYVASWLIYSFTLSCSCNDGSPKRGRPIWPRDCYQAPADEDGLVDGRS